MKARHLVACGMIALFASACAAASGEEQAATDEGELVSGDTDFYAIAHMTNTPAAARWAVAEGANAVEIDLRFKDDGTPDSFRHGGGVLCDCLCSLGHDDHVCAALDGGCEASTPVASMFETLASMPEPALGHQRLWLGRLS